MDDWKKFDKTSLLEKEYLNSHLNMKDITDADYVYAKEFSKISKKKLQENIMIYMFQVILLLADVFEHFRNMCLEIYELDPVKFLSVPRLAQQGALKKTKVKFN